MRGPLHLTRRLVLEAPERVPDGAGGFSTAWTPLGTLWAAVEAGPPRRDAERTRRAVRVGVRAAPPGAPSRPEPGQRFREGDRTLPILAVREQGPRGRTLVCDAVEEGAP